MSALFPRRFAVAVAIAGLAASFANPASATGCYVEANADVTAPFVTVRVRYWYDEGQDEPGVKGEQDVHVIVHDPAGGTTDGPITGQTYEPEGPGLVEQYTGVDVREIVCGALES